MAVTLRSNANITFQCAFHVVWCPKYRRRVLGGRIEARLKELIREVVDAAGCMTCRDALCEPGRWQ